MALDMTGASVVTTKVSDEIRRKVIAQSRTAALLIASGNVQYGVKGKAAVLKMDSDVIFQDGATCGRNNAGDTKLSNVFIEVKALKDMQNLCPKALTNTYFEEFAKQGTSPENGFDDRFVSKVGDTRSKKIKAGNEVLLWQGDTTLTGTNNKKWIDGIIVQQGAVNEITVTGTSATAQMQSFISQIPIDYTDDADFGGVLFMGRDFSRAYGIELTNKNMFKDPDNMKVLGTDIQLEPVPGLNGTNKIYFTQLSNLHLGLDGQGEDDKFDMWYSKDNAMWFMDFWWTIGIKVIEPTEMWWATITPVVFGAEEVPVP